ncbi:glutamate permease [Streptomyces albus]|uniref:Glutamate permease n=1 Tax=Streptomyces albus (strain ATCC 21838 / DSM 41398 / FERM P-419 / JCM 4703 / NBRC 107858) TaxID=1081613 RepID=A0A0B5ET24_STRA4|nr:glutamate permease [Streptomyces albus]AOU76202.1 glutamate permease [Streptomyces albus]AYN31992.1 amino acid ABC transporter permease [Streptomyces albus]
MSSVLYDTPGPRARIRNRIITVVFLALLALVLWWAWEQMDQKKQLDWSLWKPFTTSEAWTTYLLPGLANTLKAAALSMVIALPLGALLGIGRLSDHRWIRVPVSAVVEFLRAIPVLLMMLFAYQLYVNAGTISSEDRPFYAVVTGLVLYNASVLAEIVRAGILALPRGQTEAAQSVGLRKGQTMRSVLLPQAVTTMLPAIVSQLVVIVKDTALGGAILTFDELLNSSKTLASNYTNMVQALTVAAVIYIILNLLLTTFASRLEAWLRRSKRSTGAILGADAVEDINAPGKSANLPHNTGEGGGAGGGF